MWSWLSNHMLLSVLTHGVAYQSFVFFSSQLLSSCKVLQSSMGILCQQTKFTFSLLHAQKLAISLIWQFLHHMSDACCDCLVDYFIHFKLPSLSQFSAYHRPTSLHSFNKVYNGLFEWASQLLPQGTCFGVIFSSQNGVLSCHMFQSPLFPQTTFLCEIFALFISLVVWPCVILVSLVIWLCAIFSSIKVIFLPKNKSIFIGDEPYSFFLLSMVHFSTHTSIGSKSIAHPKSLVKA